MNMKHLYTSLDSGVISGSVTDNSITDDSVIEIYFDNTDCYIDTTSQSGHTVYFTVGGNATGTNVCVVVNNLTNFTPYNDTDIRGRVTQAEQDITNLETTVENLDNLVTTLETDVETLDTKVDGLNANNISYDEHSTLYSAMGDIDELETTSKNLVGAINEVKESGGGGGGSESYSTTETVIGTWIDGKTLYRKVLTISNIPSQGGTLSANLGVSAEACMLRGFMKSKTTNGYARPLPMVDSNQANNIRLDLNNNVVRLIIGATWDSYEAYIIAEYTKTTD